jgi:nitrogen PTS system EIIA component
MDLGVREAAALLKVSEKTIYRWINSGKLPAYRVQDQYRFNRVELLEWATASHRQVSHDIFREPQAGVPLPTLAQALQTGGINYRVEGSNREEVLRTIVDQIRVPEEVDREFLFRVLLAREELGSTGIGDGIAIPHVRNPVVLHVAQPTITLSFLEHPVDFNALDRKPVQALFTIISPTVRAHLHMLSRLAFALRDESFQAGIRRQALREELFSNLHRIENGFAEDANVNPGTAAT